MSAIIWLLAAYCLAHPPLQESEVHGSLLPAHEQAPKNTCANVPANAVLIMLGNIPVYATKFPHRVVSVDKDEVLLSIAKSEKGMAVSAKVFSEDGKVVAEIINNEFFLNPSNYFRRERPDKHSLIVYDLRGEQVLNVRYLNERAIRLFAHLKHPAGAEVKIYKDIVVATEPSMAPQFPDAKLGNLFFGETQCMIDRKVDIALHTHKEFRALFGERDRIDQMRDPNLKSKAEDEWRKRKGSGIFLQWDLPHGGSDQWDASAIRNQSGHFFRPAAFERRNHESPKIRRLFYLAAHARVLLIRALSPPGSPGDLSVPIRLLSGRLC